MSKENIEILQISDTHLFEDPKGELCGQNTESSLDAVLAHAQKTTWPPDLILVTGDISQDQTEASYQRFREKFEKLNVPIYCCPGNHDNPEVMSKILTGGKVNVGRNFNWQDWQLILLNTTIPESNDGSLAVEELNFLEKSLNESTQAHSLVGFHHSPVTVKSQWMDKMAMKNADQFFEVVDRFSKVRAVIWGHIHQEYEGERKAVKLFGTPSTSVQFRPQSDQFGFDQKAPGYRWLQLHKNGRIDSKIIRNDGFSVSVDMNAKGY